MQLPLKSGRLLFQRTGLLLRELPERLLMPLRGQRLAGIDLHLGRLERLLARKLILLGREVAPERITFERPLIAERRLLCRECVLSFIALGREVAVQPLLEAVPRHLQHLIAVLRFGIALRLGIAERGLREHIARARFSSPVVRQHRPEKLRVCASVVARFGQHRLRAGVHAGRTVEQPSRIAGLHGPVLREPQQRRIRVHQLFRSPSGAQLIALIRSQLRRRIRG